MRRRGGEEERRRRRRRRRDEEREGKEGKKEMTRYSFARSSIPSIRQSYIGVVVSVRASLKQ
jgi:hypothetical protein